MASTQVSVLDLSTDPHPIWHRLRNEQPVAWIDPLQAWLVTSHALCNQVMFDPETFTVDDPRFSTQQVIGPSMLSLDGAQHKRHRDPFAGPFRAGAIRELETYTRRTARELIAQVAAEGAGDLRERVAGPLAVRVMARILDLDVEPGEVLSWYEYIVDAVHAVTAGEEVPHSGLLAFEDLTGAVVRNRDTSRLLGPVEESGNLDVDEIVSNVAVLLFGGIVTSESSIAIAFRYLLDDPELMGQLMRDRTLVRPFVEETFRLEPSAGAVDRYAARDVTLGGVSISEGDLVRVSLSAANRDPAVFADPDRLELTRAELGKSLTFARGPHACLGIHLARLETGAAVDSLLDHGTGLMVGDLDPIKGLVFRVPATVAAFWP